MPTIELWPQLYVFNHVQGWIPRDYPICGILPSNLSSGGDMPPKTVNPPAAPLLPDQIPWMEHPNWSFAHRVARDGRVLCMGERVRESGMAELTPQSEKRLCNNCQAVTGRSAL
jgi:hypothetical protein